MKAVASRVTEKSDVLLLTAVDMEDSGPFEIAEPRAITALETYTPSCKPYRRNLSSTAWLTIKTGLQIPRLKRLAEIVSQQAMAQAERNELDYPDANGIDGQVMAEAVNGNDD